MVLPFTAANTTLERLQLKYFVHVCSTVARSGPPTLKEFSWEQQESLSLKTWANKKKKKSQKTVRKWGRRIWLMWNIMSLQQYERITCDHLSSVAKKDRRSNNRLSLLPSWVKRFNPLLQISRLVFCGGERPQSMAAVFPRTVDAEVPLPVSLRQICPITAAPQPVPGKWIFFSSLRSLLAACM